VDPQVTRIHTFLLTFAAAFVLCAPVFAQVAAQVAAPSGGVDFTPVANSLITTVGSALGVAATVVAGFLMQFLFAKAKLNDAQLEQLMASRLNEILLKSIDFGEAWLKAQVADPSSPIKHMTFNNLVLDVMARYAAASAPEIIAKFKLTDARIKDMIRARIAPYLMTPVADQGELHTITAAPVAPAVPAAA
jgi:hypothetical protein